jgi:nitroreductase
MYNILMTALETIQRRLSVRRYSDKSIETSVREDLGTYFEEAGKGLFGNLVRFKLLDLGPMSREEMRSLGTYGFIKGAKLFVLAAVKENRCAFEDIGYCMEKVILKATELGLGTCWLGGTFRRSAFAAKMELSADEMLPAITPVGYTNNGSFASDRVLRYTIGSVKRHPWRNLFYEVNDQQPLEKASAADFVDALEAVRIAPSASNKQPWRIVKGENSHQYHLYLKENKLYNRLLGKIRIQHIDMGIAMCHFEMVAREQGLSGGWEVANPGSKYDGLQYIATWVS